MILIGKPFFCAQMLIFMLIMLVPADMKLVQPEAIRPQHFGQNLSAVLGSLSWNVDCGHNMVCGCHLKYASLWCDKVRGALSDVFDLMSATFFFRRWGYACGGFQLFLIVRLVTINTQYAATSTTATTAPIASWLESIVVPGTSCVSLRHQFASILLLRKRFHLS